VGTTKGGVSLYKSTNEKLIRFLYDEYIVGRGNDVISYEKFRDGPNNLIFMDGLGRWNLLVNSEYGTAAECAKPVIYLYPRVETLVDVRVGARVRVSEPTYDSSRGWEGVLARPDGRLTYRGKDYDSLYWDGLGYGEYPSVEGVGVIVRQKDMVAVIRAQLAAQGLNAKEIKDFVAFWGDNLPKGEYVKLSWLSLAQIDRLAPLSVVPRPESVIRVFLDAESVPVPVELAGQKFTAPRRNGFTLVEWGGLLH